jgi:hypothetical protein
MHLTAYLANGGWVVALLAMLALVALTFSFGFAPRFVNDWVTRQMWDSEAAIRALVKYRNKGEVSPERFEELKVEMDRVFSDSMRLVELKISLQDRKARVARRRPIQRKLGRI